MEMQKRLSAILFFVLLLCTISITAYAHDVPDSSRKGSVSVTMRTTETAVPGGTLTLYRVGDVYEDNGNYSFVLSGDFSGSKEPLKDIQSAALAKSLSDYAKKNNLTGTTQTIDNNGKVDFTDLKLGLYLLVQNKAAEGYNEVDPFLVSVPMMENGVYVYDVDASPKVETLTKTPGNPTKPTQPTNPTSATNSTGTIVSKLPQTGQLNWPIPVLVVTSLFLFSAGWILRL